MTTRAPRPHTTSKPLSAKDADELARLTSACSRIRAHIPELPYALSAPVNVEPRYHYPSRQEAESWRANTPFHLHEEALQYMTYVYREPGESCFVVRSHVDEERERAQERERRERERTQLQSSQGGGGSAHIRNGSRSEVGSVASTGPGTPTAGPAKKKISLSAYKEKKEAGGGKAETRKEQSPEKEVPSVKKAAEVKKKQEQEVNGAGDELKMEDFEVKNEDMDALLPAGTKRAREPEVEKPSAAADKAPVVKKPRLSPPPSLSSKTARQTSPRPSLQPSAIDHPNGAPHGLPALLSPTNPFEDASKKPTPTSTPEKKKKDAGKWSLPMMLSPTLPPRIEQELLKEKERGRLDSTTSSPASKATRTPGSAARSPAITARSIGKLEESPLAKVKDGTRARAKDEDSEDDDEPAPARVERPKRLIVRLKYNKKLAYRVKRLLANPPNADREKYPLDEDFFKRQKERPTSKSIVEITSNSKSRPRSSSDVDSPLQRAKKDGADHKKDRLHPDSAKSSAKVPEKRPRQDDSESAPSSKKQKVPSSLDLEKEKNPRTPITSAIPSPSVQKSGGSMKDSITVTPRQGHLKTAVSMARSASQDSPVATPNGKNASSTPLASSSASKQQGKGPTSAPSNAAATGPRAAEMKALLDQSQKYNALGRKLKHENQDINSRPTKSEPERKRMALLGMECIMAYILAYSLVDSRRKIEGRSAEIETSWRSLLPLFRHMSRFVAGYRPLEGLHAYLGITINARISLVAGERVMRLSNLPVAADSPQSTVTTSAGDTQGMENMRIHFDAVAAMTEATREAAQKLPPDELMASFPATWNSRSKEARGPSMESLLDEKKGEVRLEGGYWVPVGIDSAPVQAVRFGCQLVKEWIKIEELGYEPRIRI